MSVIVAKGEQISKSPVNTSKSKQLYTIPKEERFKKLKLSGSDVIYQLPELRAKRSTSFGYGKRSDFTLGAKGKCAEFYNVKSIFEDKKNGSPSYTFGIARSFYEKVYNESDTFHDKNFPGPGAYPILKDFGYGANKFSISGKLEPKNVSKKTVNPGPGNYETTANIQGKYMFSKFKNTTNVIWSIDKSPRFDYRDKNKIPGPEKYDIKPLINGKGQVFISKFQSSPGKTIGSKYYDSKNKVSSKYSDKIDVGPGSYKYYSDFGIYESKNKESFLAHENERLAQLNSSNDSKAK